MSIESMTTAAPQKVTGLNGLGDAAHFERLRTALFGTRGSGHFDRAAAHRILDDLRHVAYRRGRQAAEVFQFLDQGFIDEDEDLQMAQADLDGMSRNLPFIREVTSVVEEIESIQDEMPEEAQLFFGWRPYAGRWAFPNPVWNELLQAFQDGRDDAERNQQENRCPSYVK